MPDWTTDWGKGSPEGSKWNANSSGPAGVSTPTVSAVTSYRVTPLPAEMMTFDGSKLTWSRSDGTVITVPAYSGKPGSTSADQNKQDYGPLPEGKYRIDSSNIQEWTDTIPEGADSDEYFTRSKGAWGLFRTLLEPLTYKGPRYGFFLHGGDYIGSAGCIDIGPECERILPMIREGNRDVTVTVRYPPGGSPPVPDPPQRWQ